MRFMHGLRIVAVALAVSGCRSPPPPLPTFDAAKIQSSGGAAYLWTAGQAKQPDLSFVDFAVVISIDDRALPPEYRPSAGIQPLGAWRMEIPAGRHFVVVLVKEFNPYIPFCWNCVTEKETRVVEFTAEAGRAYRPLASDKCGHKWVWIADAGSASPDAPMLERLTFVEGLPTVGGDSPPAGSC